MKRPDGLMQAETRLVVPLQALSAADLEGAGGKGANLGELVRTGFPVPPGFVVMTAAYEQFVSDNGLQGRISRSLQTLPGSGAAIQAIFEGAPIPPQVERAILAAYRQLGQVPVAVRSSATAEDLPQAAFAGQQDTYLNIVGNQALLQAVCRCWASLWNERAMVYRERQGVNQATVKIAVVVQRLVAAEMAGVMFSANPVSGRRQEIWVDANPGLGEAVVSGLVTPDHFVLRRRWWGWRIGERQAGQRQLMIQALAGGGVEQLSGAAVAQLPALPDRVLRRLARVGIAIQRHFGTPQDIEWAWADGRLFILQARPMTALPSPPPKANLAQRLIANNFLEMLPLRPYPLDLDTWLTALGGAVEPLFGLLGVKWSFRELFVDEDGVVVRYEPRLPRPTVSMLLAPMRLVSRSLRYHPLQWQSDGLLADGLARARELAQRDLQRCSWEELLALVQAAKEISFLAGGEIRCRYFPGAAFAAARLRLILTIVGRKDHFGRLISGAENKTLEMNRALEELANKVRSDPGLANTFAKQPAEMLATALAEEATGRAFLTDLGSFMDRYGHRETVISSALQPTWKAAPEMALGVIKSFAAYPALPPGEKPPWQLARDDILQQRLLHLAPVRKIFLKTLAEARSLMQIREDTHFYATLALPVFRQTALEFGRRLAAAGIVESAEEVFHLKLAELEQVDDRPPPAAVAALLRSKVQQRKIARAGLDDTPLVDPRLYPPKALAGDALQRGMPGSPGVATGPVRILRDSSEFDKLVPGDVLVAPYTNPSWTVLFQRAVAVVVDSGSPASHAAIVAREYGIPAVMGTMNGTKALRDGEWVRVDGNQGAVFAAVPPQTPAPGQVKESRTPP